MYNINLSEILGNKEVTLQDMLDTRERRASEQRRILSGYNITLII